MMSSLRQRFHKDNNNVEEEKVDKFESILRTGPSLLAALHKLHEVVWSIERKPDSWRDTILIQIDKGRNKDKSNLNNRRHIHTKEEIPKVFSHIVTTSIKPFIVNDMSPNQIGAVPGHRSQEHLFTVKSLMALTEKNNEALALQLFDLKKYFNRECLVDCLGELYRANVKGKLYKLIHELNKNTRIRVRTAVGDSETREINEGVAQGSMEASLISSSSLWKGTSDIFASSECEISYGNFTISTFEYQDDIFHACKSPPSA